MSESLVDSIVAENKAKAESQKTVEDLVRAKISDKKLTEEEVSEILARFQSEREKIETDFNSCKIDLQNETATELYNLAKETINEIEEPSKPLYKDLISKMEERCEFLKPQEVQTTENTQEISEEDKIFQSEEFKNLDDKTKEKLTQNITWFKDYLSHYWISIPEWIIDFVEGLKYVDNLESSNFKILKEKILWNLVPFLHLQREFKRFDFKNFTFEDVLSLAYSESEFNPNAISETWSVWLLQTTTNVVKDISERPDLYDISIANELASRNWVASLKELSTESRSRFDNSIVLWLLYLKQLETTWNTYEYDILVVLKDKENFFKLTTKYLWNKWISITREQFDGFLWKLKSNPNMLVEYSSLKDYNWQTNKYSWEKYSHRVYYAVSILCMSELMKKG